MKEISLVEKFIAVVLFFVILFYLSMGMYNIGYKAGQKDALMGKFQYQLETNVVAIPKKR